MSGIEIALKIAKEAFPIAERLAAEAIEGVRSHGVADAIRAEASPIVKQGRDAVLDATTFGERRVPLGTHVRGGIQAKASVVPSPSHLGWKPLTSEQLWAIASKHEPSVPFKTLESAGIVRTPAARSLTGERALRELGGELIYANRSGDKLSVVVPSAQEVRNLPTSELIDMIKENRGSLLQAISDFKPGEYPKLGWHGTSTRGKDFLFENKQSFGAQTNRESPLWIHTPVHEGANPADYLNDTQHSIQMSSHINPTGDDSAGHSLVVLDRSIGDWAWQKKVGLWKQHLTRDPYPDQGGILDEYIGPESKNLGKTQVDINPHNFDVNVLGTFDNTPRNIELDMPRNYFDKWKFQRVFVAQALENQEFVAHSWELSGVLKRLKK